MLTCITCSKQEREGDESARGTPNTKTKEAVKSLTAQIKDMAVKFSGACKPCTGSSSSTSYPPSFPPAAAISSNSMSASLDFPSIGPHPTSRLDSRFNGQLRSGGGGGGGAGAGFAEGIGVAAVVQEEDHKEWVAQVETGVQITFLSLPNGGNDLKRIRFSREMFDKWEAQRWWGENYDRIMELYNVHRFNQEALHTPARSNDDGRDSSYCRLGSARESPMTPSLNKEWIPRNYNKPSSASKPMAYSFPSDSSDQGGNSNYYNGGSSAYHAGVKGAVPSIDAPRTTTSSRDEALVSISNASDVESEWVEQDELGVYITIRQLADGTRELRRVRFSRERFGEMHAKLWWEQNRERIQDQYL